MNTEPSQTERLQFAVGSLFVVTAIIAVGLLPIVWLGVIGIVPAIGLWCAGVCLMCKRYSLAVGIIIVLMSPLLLIPVTGNARPAARQNACIINIKHITLAILNYESDHGHLPPPYTTDEQGSPLHSWRVLILPYLDEQDLYNAIDLTKPWYHPRNIALQSRMPAAYRCPGFDPGRKGLDVTTAYVAIVGDHTAWPRSGTRSLSEITDGPSKTLAVIESEHHRLHWMSTADPGIEMIGPLNAQGETLLSRSNHEGRVIAAMLDAHCEFLSDDTPLEELLDMITIDGNDPTPFDGQSPGQ